MQATVETISNLERRMTVAVPIKPIEEEVSQRLKRMAKTVKMSGFRPGKVPFSLVEKNYGQQVRDEVFSTSMERSFSDAISQNNLRVAGYPNIEQKPLADDAEHFEYIATFEVFPEITVGDLSGASIERPALEVSDADVDRTIEVLRKQRVSFEPVKRAAKKGDQVSIVFRAEIDNQEVESTQGQAIQLVLGEDGRIAEFDDNLVGGKAETTKKFDITYPEDNPNQHLAGKTVSYEVEFKSVAQPKLPEVDAEFAKDLGVEDGDVAKMRAEIKESLEQEVSKRVRAIVKEQVFKALVAASTFDLPNSLVAIEMNRLLQAARQGLEQRGVDPSQIKLEPAMFDEQAKRNVSLRLILGDLVSKNGLHATPEQVRAMVEEFAQSFEHPDEVVRWYFADPQRLDEPMGLATEENVVAWVLERAKVTDKAIAFEALMGNKA
jgi:trigger factor